MDRLQITHSDMTDNGYGEWVRHRCLTVRNPFYLYNVDPYWRLYLLC